MKKIIVLGILFMFCPLVMLAQQKENHISEKEWDTLIELLKTEKWDKVEKVSKEYLKRFEKASDTLTDPAIVRYMYLRCVGAELGEKKITKEQSLKKVSNLIGKTIITPPRQFREKCVFNCLKLTEDNQNLSSCGSNNDNTIIQTFETYIMADPTVIKNISQLENKDLRLGGYIKSINAEGFTMPRLEVIFDNAFIWEEE